MMTIRVFQTVAEARDYERHGKVIYDGSGGPYRVSHGQSVYAIADAVRQFHLPQLDGVSGLVVIGGATSPSTVGFRTQAWILTDDGTQYIETRRNAVIGSLLSETESQRATIEQAFYGFLADWTADELIERAAEIQAVAREWVTRFAGMKKTYSKQWGPSPNERWVYYDNVVEGDMQRQVWRELRQKYGLSRG